MKLPHWYGERIDRSRSTLGRLPALLPAFERRVLPRHRTRDLIVRAPAAGEKPGEELPVGMVSKRYTLVQHVDAIAAVSSQLAEAGIDPARVPVRLELSEYGTRMALCAILPDRFDFTAPDGHAMALTFECLNSVDGSVPLFAAVGWFRYICHNGLMLGEACALIRQRHVPSLNIEEFSDVLASGVATATLERERFLRWDGSAVSPPALAAWVDGPVTDAWGTFAAARVKGIAATGFDGRPVRGARGGITLTDPSPVPGSVVPCRSAYDAAQALAWVAARRVNVAERLEWRARIPELTEALVGAS